MEQARTSMKRPGSRPGSSRSSTIGLLKVGAGHAGWSARLNIWTRGESAFRGDVVFGGEFEKRALYEEVYCARGEMENRIKEQQLTVRGSDLHRHDAEQPTSSVLLVDRLCLLEALRRLGLRGDRDGAGQCGTIRLKLLKMER